MFLGDIAMIMFNQRLKELRKASNKTQVEMSIFLKITSRQYQSYELDKSYPSFHGLIALADYFQVSLDYLVGRSDNPEIKK